MRFLVLFVAIFAFCQTAHAQTQDCKSIADSSLRLSCYDKAAPPAAVKPAAKAKADSSKYVDSIGAEDALMNARLKNICKGC